MGFNVVIKRGNYELTYRISMRGNSGHRTIAQGTGYSRNGWLAHWTGQFIANSDPAAEAYGLLLLLEALGPGFLELACQDATSVAENYLLHADDYEGQIKPLKGRVFFGY